MFVTSCPFLGHETLELLRGRVWKVVTTNNNARDFGLYYIGVRLIEEMDQPIILTNDSVVALNSLDPLFKAARSGIADVTGAIDSWLHNWHLQSFFLYCGKSAVQSPAWTEFWKYYRPLRNKWFVINSHEFGFSRFMIANNLRLHAVWKYDDILSSMDPQQSSDFRQNLVDTRGNTHPTLELWDLLLEQDFPFLKRQVFTEPLLSNNRAELCNVISRLGHRKERAPLGKKSS